MFGIEICVKFKFRKIDWTQVSVMLISDENIQRTEILPVSLLEYNFILVKSRLLTS
jgi:hypothetical protein